MDKIKINNQVVSMRKYVKQAKIRAINKCAKQIKFLENRKGNEEQMAKTKRKLQRLLEEVNILKKIKPDSVSKLALSKAKDWKVVLAEKNVPLEERCFAMLANHPPVQEAVEKFHSDNDELIPKIPDLVKEWDVKKSRSSQIKKQKGNKNNATGSNTLPIGNKHNDHKSSKAQIKHQSTESLENLPDRSDLKGIHNSITGRNVTVEKTTKRKESSDDIFEDSDPPSDMNEPAKKKSLVVDDAKSNESDDSLSDSSEFTHHDINQTEEALPINFKTKSGQFNNNSKQSKAFIRNHKTNSTEKELLINEEAVDDDSEAKVKSNGVERSEKLQDIRSKFLEMSKTKPQSKPRNKCFPGVHQLNAEVETDSDNEDSADGHRKLDNSANISSPKTKPSFPTKPEVKNKIKAITMLDLNELQDVDEIPIDKSDRDAEDETDEDSEKPKKDPFFLRDGEPVSGSDDDENARKRDFPPFKKKPYGGLNRRERRGNTFRKGREEEGNSFQRRGEGRKFEKHSADGFRRNSNFRENSFMKNKKELPFNDSRQNFKRTFDNNSEFRQNKNFKFAPKDKFSNRNSANNFTKKPKEKSFSQNHSRDFKQNSYSSKPKLSIPPKTVNDDKPLHPSWAAKKKLKEAATLKFQGKRTVFND